MSLTDKLNEVRRDELVSLREIKRLKEREIKALFINIESILINIKSTSQEIKSDLDLKIKDLEERIKVLEDARKET